MTETTEAMLARVRASFDRQAMMTTLGVEVIAVEPGRVEMSLRHDDRFTQQHGFLHAGAVASVLDTACGYAAYSVMPPEASVLTATYTINLLAPAAGERFAITGEVVRAGRTLVVCRGEAFADAGQRPFAVMQATMTADLRPARHQRLSMPQWPDQANFRARRERTRPGLVEPAGGGRAPVDRVGQLGPDDGQALSLYRRALARRQRQDGLQGRDRGVERAGPQPRDGQVGVREHLALAAVVLARARPGRIQPDRALKLGDRLVDGCPIAGGTAAGRLGHDEARVVGLGGPGEAELAADLEQLIGVLAVPGVARGRDRLVRARGVAEAGRSQPAEQVQLRRVLAVGEMLQTARWPGSRSAPGARSSTRRRPRTAAAGPSAAGDR